MKRLLSLLLLAALAASLHAAAPVVVIDSLTSVTVNGRAVGTVVDALANGGDAVRGPMLDALIAYDAARVVTVNAQRDAAIAEAQVAARKERDAAVTAAKAAQAEAEAKADALRKEAAAKLDAAK